jgi:DNA excision repair protein ERCC-4
VSEAGKPISITVVVDDREPRPGLADAIASIGRPVVVGRLPVGDVEIGPRVLIERKTVADFVLSVEDGRLFEQAWALRGASWRPLLVVEGEAPYDAARLSSRQMRGILASLVVGCGVPLLRTASTSETALWVDAIARQEERRLARRGPRTKPTDARVAMDVLGAIPGVGDGRARRLVERFGSVAGVTGADERDLCEVPGIGLTTARAIREALGGAGRVSESAA